MVCPCKGFKDCAQHIHGMPSIPFLRPQAIDGFQHKIDSPRRAGRVSKSRAPDIEAKIVTDVISSCSYQNGNMMCNHVTTKKKTYFHSKIQSLTKPVFQNTCLITSTIKPYRMCEVCLTA